MINSFNIHLPKRIGRVHACVHVFRIKIMSFILIELIHEKYRGSNNLILNSILKELIKIRSSEE